MIGQFAADMLDTHIVDAIGPQNLVCHLRSGQAGHTAYPAVFGIGGFHLGRSPQGNHHANQY